jgi:hypothetical protein
MTLKKELVCRKCKQPYSYRVGRGWLVKTLLFFLPLRRYFCARCDRKRYVLSKFADLGSNK